MVVRFVALSLGIFFSFWAWLWDTFFWMSTPNTAKRCHLPSHSLEKEGRCWPKELKYITFIGDEFVVLEQQKWPTIKRQLYFPWERQMIQGSRSQFSFVSLFWLSSYVVAYNNCRNCHWWWLLLWFPGMQFDDMDLNGYQGSSLISVKTKHFQLDATCVDPACGHMVSILVWWPGTKVHGFWARLLTHFDTACLSQWHP